MPTQTFHDVIESTVELAAPRASSAGLSLRCHIEPTCKDIVNFDAWCVSQLLSNLLNNALTYTEAGSVSVYASSQSEGTKSHFEMRVEDSGPGISEDIQRIMFTLPDQREELEGANRIGFGLVIAQQLCELLNANLQIDQPEHGGTIARVQGVFDHQLVVRTAEYPLPDFLRDSHALIIDSDIAARRLLEAHLRSWGIHVSTALDTASGITTLRQSASQGNLVSMVFVSAETPGAALSTLIDMLRTDEAYTDILMVMLGKDSETSSFATLSGPLANITLVTPVRPSALFDCIARHPQVRAQVSGPNETPQEQTQTRVLLVEDNVVNQCVATEILKRIGVDVEVANNGVEAVRAVEQSQFDFVFMDCQMPEMDGFAATRAMREMPELKDLPIVALTANALSGDRQRCLDAGMSDYLTKPFTREQLETMLDKWLEREQTLAIPVGDYSDTIIIDLIDETALSQIRMLDEGSETTIFDEILDEYFSSSRELTAEIDAAVQSGDCEAVARAAHALKSSSAAVGLMHFSSQCSELDQLSREESIEAVRALWATAQHTYERSFDALMERRSQKVA